MNPYQALIDAAEWALETLTAMGHKDIACALSLRSAISSAKAAEVEVDERVTALKVENDRLQTSNAALRRRLDGIANQYAVDCL